MNGSLSMSDRIAQFADPHFISLRLRISISVQQVRALPSMNCLLGKLDEGDLH